MIKLPILSICIPTFNRLHYLRQLLEAVLPQAELLGVEVCVSDNNSQDGTALYLESLTARYNMVIRYIIQSENIGLDRNMIEVIAMGRGQYIYPIGDDDILIDGSLKEILQELETECDVLMLNGWHTNPVLVPKKIHLPDTIAGKCYVQPDQAFVMLWNKMPFGSFLASRDCFLKNDFQKYIGTSHAYTGAVWDALSDKARRSGSCNVRCMKFPVVLLRGAEKSWSKSTAKIMLIEIPLWFCLISEKEVYFKSVSIIKNQYLRSQTRFLSLAKFRVIGQLCKDDVPLLGAGFNGDQVLTMTIVIHMPKLILLMLINLNRLYCFLLRKLSKSQ